MYIQNVGTTTTTTIINRYGADDQDVNDRLPKIMTSRNLPG